MGEQEWLPYGRQWIDDDDVEAVARALKGDFLTTGPAVEAFERELSAVMGGAGVVAVSSGTAALHAAYAAAELGPGRVLVTTPLTFAGTASAALHLGAEVRFVDVTDDTLNLDPALLPGALDDRVAVVAPVDYAGHPAPIGEILAAADAVGAVVVEDAAHAIGGSLDGVAVGALSPMTTFSFHPVKTVTTAEGGAVSTLDDRFADSLRRFRNHGLVREPSRLRRHDEGGWHQEVQTLGLNYRLPDVLCTLGVSQLRRLDAFVARRRALVARYDELLADVHGLRRPTVRPGADPAWHIYPVRVLEGRRRELYDGLRARSIGTQVHYLPVHLQPLFEDLGFRRGLCPVAEQAYTELLSLPLFPLMTDDLQHRVVDAVREILGS